MNLKSIVTSCKDLSNQLKHKGITEIVTLARGGFVPARFIAKNLNIRRIHSIGMEFYSDVGQTMKYTNIYQHLTHSFTDKDIILLVDDIADSGGSLSSAIEEIKSSNGKRIITCTLYYKQRSSIRPDYYGKQVPDDTWIIFPFE